MFEGERQRHMVEEEEVRLLDLMTAVTALQELGELEGLSLAVEVVGNVMTQAVLLLQPRLP
jgi:hypothetical protein